MKAVLEFDLSDPDERQEHLRCIKSLDMSLALFEISYNLKRDCEDVIDGIEGKANSDMHKGMEIAFKKIYEVLEEKGINLDELIT